MMSPISFKECGIEWTGHETRDIQKYGNPMENMNKIKRKALSLGPDLVAEPQNVKKHQNHIENIKVL